MNTVGKHDVIQYLEFSFFKNILIPASFPQVSGFIEDHDGQVHSVILPLTLKSHSPLSSAWGTNTDDQDQLAGTVIDIPSNLYGRIGATFACHRGVRQAKVALCQIN